MPVDVVGETRDPAGKRVIVPAALWQDKILRDHPELATHLDDVLRAIAEPDHVVDDLSTSSAAGTTCAEPVLVAGCSWS